MLLLQTNMVYNGLVDMSIVSRVHKLTYNVANPACRVFEHTCSLPTVVCWLVGW